jgi:hypothetical protein
MTRITSLLSVLFLVLSVLGCEVQEEAQSASGLSQTSVEVKTGADGLTTEQRNIGKRYQMDNEPGAVKHLYVISPYSGQVLIYSTVVGKVTSSGKRLTPTSVVAAVGITGNTWDGFLARFGGAWRVTTEVLQDDGTYGTSDPYIYWFDQRGAYHQHYMTGGQILHISDQPLAVKSIIINMEVTGASTGEVPLQVPAVP